MVSKKTNKSKITPNPVWETVYPYRTVDVFVGKKNKHTMDVIAGLAINGSATTTELAKFVIHWDKEYLGSGVKLSEISSQRGQAYYRRIVWAEHKKTGKKKLSEKNPTLLDLHYVRRVETIVNEKNKETQRYALTLKGCLVALGFDFSNKELKSFIDNASRTHIFFAFLKIIVNNTSISFVKKLFVKPIQAKIKKRVFVFNENDFVQIYSSNIANFISRKFYDIVHNAVVKSNETVIMYKNKPLEYIKSKNIPENVSLEDISFGDISLNDIREMKNVKRLMNNIIYNEKIEYADFDPLYAQEIRDELVSKYFPEDKNAEYFYRYSEHYEVGFLCMVFRQLHYAYYGAGELGIPKKHRKIRSNEKIVRKKDKLPKSMTGREYYNIQKEKGLI